MNLTQPSTHAVFLEGPLAYLLNWVPGEIEDLEIGEVDEGRPLQRR